MIRNLSKIILLDFYKNLKNVSKIEYPSLNNYNKMLDLTNNLKHITFKSKFSIF